MTYFAGRLFFRCFFLMHSDVLRTGMDGALLGSTVYYQSMRCLCAVIDWSHAGCLPRFAVVLAFHYKYKAAFQSLKKSSCASFQRTLNCDCILHYLVVMFVDYQ